MMFYAENCRNKNNNQNNNNNSNNSININFNKQGYKNLVSASNATTTAAAATAAAATAASASTLPSSSAATTATAASFSTSRPHTRSSALDAIRRWRWRRACGAGFGLALCALLLLCLTPAATSLAVGVDTSNANLTDLGSPASVCAQQKNGLIPHGSQQFYELVNKVTMTDLKPAGAEEASYTLRAHLQVNSVWSDAKAQLLQVYLSEATVAAPVKARPSKLLTQPITQWPDRPFYISLADGQPSKVIAHTSRDQSLLNLQRGIASLLQVRYENGPHTETDVSGRCNAFYALKSSTRIEKVKTDCSAWDLRVNYRAEKALSVSQQSREQIHFELSAEGALLKVESNELHRVALESKPDVGSQVESQLLLKHIAANDEAVEQLDFATLDETIASLLEWYRVFDIEADVDGAISEIKEQTLKQQIAAHADQLADAHIGQQSLAVAFAELLPLARITKRAEFVEILQAHKPLHAQLVDLLGAVQTIEAHNAIHEVLKHEKQSDADLLEKYLQSLAVGTHPERAIITELFARLRSEEQPIRNEKLRDTVLQTVASLAKQSGFEANDALQQELREYIVAQLQTHCNNVDCKTLHIRALQNLQDSTTLASLIEHALAGEAKVSVAAMQALKSFPIVHFNEQHRKAFAQLFYQRQRKFDSSARTLALDILLALKPSKQQLGELLDYLASNDRHFEIKTYVIQKLRMLAEKCSRFSALLGACLAERPKVNNYHIIAQKGLTTALTRQLSQTPAFNESLLSIQEIYQGVLKRGSVELIQSAGREETSTFKLGIYTSGLNSFVGDNSGDDAVEDDDDEAADDNPATAGMEISVQGVLLRPLVFFTGQTELMGHVWSGTASDPTPAFQATTLAQDHEHYVLLASGASVYTRVTGAKSIDLNGKVELSIWNRNAQTEIQQNSGAAVLGVMVAGFTFAKVENHFTLTNEPKISLQADIDFYSGIKLCIQLQRPEMILTHSNTKSITLNAAAKPYSKHIRTKSTHKSPGRTLALNQKNNEMCNMIFA